LHPRGSGHDLVSIIIPTCGAGGLIEKCLATLRAKSTYRNIEIICVDHIRDPDSPWKARLREQADVVIEIDEPFNWSRFNNVAAAEASGELLLFLNDDIEITQPDWLEMLVDIARRDDVGAVGPQLRYPDGRIQHAGLFLSQPGLARHAFRFLEADDPGYFGLALSQRNVIAVTGACLMVRRSIFEQLGGFEEAHAVINNDLDFCLKCHAAGLWNVYTPYASLIHHELASRASIKDEHDADSFAARWDSIFARGDPFFHPDLEHQSDSCTPQAEPVSLTVAGGPSYRAESIRRILVVKLDHIGDFVTAFPAFRKLRQTFPEATLHVLAAPASCQLAFLEPAIDAIIPFEFFHARSGRGQQEVTEEKLEALRRELASYDFDLAVDFRKHPETRTLLKLSGARLTAGYDHQDQFPWLDIALQWEGDRPSVAKRHHISDDLINLVSSVAAAGAGPASLASIDRLKRQIPLIEWLKQQGLYSRPVVCVHPAAGAELRQWPPAYFASLINLLVEEEGVHVAIVGGPD
jgi:GT2 family glycosyltransferase